MLEIHDSNRTFQTYMELDVFTEETKNRVKGAQVILLPDFNVKEGVERAFQPDTINFYKYTLAKKDSEIKLELFENKGEEKFLVLHSYDVWIPTIAILNSVLLPLVVNLVSSYVYDRMRSRPKEEPTVHFQLIVSDEDSGRSKQLYYKGPAKDFNSSFEKIDVNSLWRDKV
jgi:hypothetical protein